MSGVKSAEFRARLESLTDEELRERRFAAYDFHDIKDPDTQAFARDLLAAVAAVETERTLRRDLRLICMELMPAADDFAFADAVFLLSRAQRELGSEPDPAWVLGEALDIARDRGKAQGGEDGND